MSLCGMFQNLFRLRSNCSDFRITQGTSTDMFFILHVQHPCTVYTVVSVARILPKSPLCTVLYCRAFSETRSHAKDRLVRLRFRSDPQIILSVIRHNLVRIFLCAGWEMSDETWHGPICHSVPWPKTRRTAGLVLFGPVSVSRVFRECYVQVRVRAFQWCCTSRLFCDTRYCKCSIKYMAPGPRRMSKVIELQPNVSSWWRVKATFSDTGYGFISLQLSITQTMSQRVDCELISGLYNGLYSL